MKKIRVWKVALLNMVTLGVYGLFWFVNRRLEMVKGYDQKIPHWAWFIVPWLVMFGMLMPVAVLLAMVNVDEQQIALIVTWYIFIGMIVAIGFSVWWLWKFAGAAEYVTNGRITRGWTIALYIVTGAVVLLFLQYYFNRSVSAKALKSAEKQEPSNKFVLTALASMVVIFLGSGVSTASVDWQQMEQANFMPQTELTAPPLQPSDIFAELNKERERQQKPALKLDENLVTSAGRSCADMERGKYYDLENPTTGHSGYEYIDEYYAGGTTMEVMLAVANFKASGIVAEWMKNPDTRDSVMSMDYVAGGVATCEYTIDNGFDTIIILHMAAPADQGEPVADPDDPSIQI